MTASPRQREEAALEVEGLHKRYRKLVALESLDLRIAPGEFVGLIGPNGAGKSTTMGCIAGVINPDAGRVRVGGVEILQDPLQARQRLSFVPQEPELHGWLTGQEYLDFVAEVRELVPERSSPAIEELLAMAELTGARHRLVKEYSGGMARKLAIAAALLGGPDLLLLDESFVGLDPESTYRLREHLQGYCAGGGAIILSSHILEMLERICTRIVMLHDGKLVLDEPIATLHQRFEAPGPPADLLETYLELIGEPLPRR